MAEYNLLMIKKETVRIFFQRARPWLVLGVWVGTIAAIVFLSYLIYLQTNLPDPESIASRRVKESTKIYDRTGKVLLYDIYNEERRTIVPWEQISQNIKNATVSSEDSNFYNHKGVDIRGIVRAFIRDIQNASLSEGGSTITQQLVKKALLGEEKTVSRKLKELLLAIEIERRFTKDEILWMYLNQIPYGSNAYGIESASETYFNKRASELTISEAALLAGIPKAPTYFSPYGSHVNELFARQKYILQRMHDLGYIDEATLKTEQAAQLTFSIKGTKIAAPHFVIMAKEYLVNKYGEDAVEGGGFKITTTLDATLQKTAEELVSKYGDINAKQYKATNAALTAIDPRSGDVLALVGSRDYFDTEHEGNFNVATALRQPGSSFKPFAYATAFNHGFPDSTVLFDIKTEFNPLCDANGLQVKDKYGAACYHPQNYDATYRGPVTMRQALAQSLNIPSVKTLYLAGVDDTITTAEQMGITTLGDRSRFGLALVLGGAEVRLIDLVSAYGVFGNDGIRNPWNLIQKVELADGTTLEEHQATPARVLPAQTARLISDVLSDNQARSAVFGANSPLYFPGHDVAAKTGTTQNNRDAWVMGYTPAVALGVWTGNNNNTPMTRAGAGISASGPLWHAFMQKALETVPNISFQKPIPVSVSKIMLNGSYSSSSEDGSPGIIRTILAYVNRLNPLGPYPANPEQDPQYKNWEGAVRAAYPYLPPVMPSPELPTPTP